jgi:hypothetical protein
VARKGREIETFRQPQPKYVLGVVLERIAGFGMGEDREPAPVHDQPRDYLAEQLGPERQLAASARMRTNGLVVHSPDGKAEHPPSLRAELTGSLAGRVVEIDVGVIARDLAHGALLPCRVP